MKEGDFKKWNVAIISIGSVANERIISLHGELKVRAVNRARMKVSGVYNIKAISDKKARIIDLMPNAKNEYDGRINPLLLIYFVSRNSMPMQASEKASRERLYLGIPAEKQRDPVSYSAIFPGDSSKGGRCHPNHLGMNYNEFTPYEFERIPRGGKIKGRRLDLDRKVETKVFVFSERPGRYQCILPSIETTTKLPVVSGLLIKYEKYLESGNEMREYILLECSNPANLKQFTEIIKDIISSTTQQFDNGQLRKACHRQVETFSLRAK